MLSELTPALIALAAAAERVWTSSLSKMAFR